MVKDVSKKLDIHIEKNKKKDQEKKKQDKHKEKKKKFESDSDSSSDDEGIFSNTESEQGHDKDRKMKNLSQQSSK